MNVKRKVRQVIVALHGIPKGFFKTDQPHSNDELLGLVRRTGSLGFEAIEIGPLSNYVPIEGGRLRTALDTLNLKRSVHVGGMFDAAKFASVEEEYAEMEQQIGRGVMLCGELNSTLVSVHPPFFAEGKETSESLLLEAKARFSSLLKKELDFAWSHNIKIAVESFCYPPFIFAGIGDFAKFISNFPSKKLSVLFEVGHLYQMGFSLSEAVRLFRDRLLIFTFMMLLWTRTIGKQLIFPSEKEHCSFRSF